MGNKIVEARGQQQKFPTWTIFLESCVDEQTLVRLGRQRAGTCRGQGDIKELMGRGRRGAAAAGEALGSVSVHLQSALGRLSSQSWTSGRGSGSSVVAKSIRRCQGQGLDRLSGLWSKRRKEREREFKRWAVEWRRVSGIWSHGQRRTVSCSLCWHKTDQEAVKYGIAEAGSGARLLLPCLLPLPLYLQ